jgi:hypothetical protein
MHVEWLILADAAQVVGSKLYLLGGGWDRLNVGGGFPTTQACSLALSFSIPWEETNQRHQFTVRIVDEDGKEAHQPINGNFEAGRPAGIAPGSSQRVQVAINLRLNFQRAGVYVVEVTVAKQPATRTAFSVMASK